MKKFEVLLAWGLLLATLASAENQLVINFLKPPPSGRPWVHGFWLNGNITSNGITARLARATTGFMASGFAETGRPVVGNVTHSTHSPVASP